MENPKNNLYYIYIDTKIEGAIDQLLGYFQSSIFNTQQCIAVYCKYYKEIEKTFAKKFKQYGVRFKYIKKNSDLVFEDHKTVFYLFNAQSNCRVVAHRNVTHIFVTHGESNKISSIKPIIKIYDYVVTAGQAGIDRYLKSGLFTLSDVEQKRIIKLGNTFIGQNHYKFVPKSQTLLYAPTWEGGVPQENYSSIGQSAIDVLSQYIVQHNIKKFVIQPHPNLGHRDPTYALRLKYFIDSIMDLGIQVILRKKKLSLTEKLFKKDGIKFQSTLAPCAVTAAYVDISAMEVQLLAKGIPTKVLCKQNIFDALILPKKVKEYYIADGVQILSKPVQEMISLDHIDQIGDYFISYEQADLETLSFTQRIEWLCAETTNRRKLAEQQCLDKY